MCLATPVKLKKVTGDKGQVAPSFAKATEGKSGEDVREVRLDLIENPRVGDWLLCHADLAVNKVDEKEALKILKIVRECGHS